MYRPADARVGSAATEISAHRVVNISVGRVRFLLEQTGRRHHLSRLAVATLRDLYLLPGLLHRVAQITREPFDRDHSLPLGARHGSNAGTDRVAIEMNHAASAEGHPTAKFRTGQPEVFAQNPQQRLLRLRLDDKRLAIYRERNSLHQFASFVNLLSSLQRVAQEHDARLHRPSLQQLQPHPLAARFEHRRPAADDEGGEADAILIDQDSLRERADQVSAAKDEQILPRLLL